MWHLFKFNWLTLKRWITWNKIAKIMFSQITILENLSWFCQPKSSCADRPGCAVTHGDALGMKTSFNSNDIPFSLTWWRTCSAEWGTPDDPRTHKHWLSMTLSLCFMTRLILSNFPVCHCPHHPICGRGWKTQCAATSQAVRSWLFSVAHRARKACHLHNGGRVRRRRGYIGGLCESCITARVLS